MINNWKGNIEKVEKLFLSFEENVLIPHSKIEMASGLKTDQSAYLYVIKQARDSLLNSGIVIKSVPGEGYMKLESKDVPKYIYAKYIVSSLDRYSKAEQILDFVQSDDENTKVQISALKNLSSTLRNNTIETMKSSQFYLETARAKEIKLIVGE